MSQLKAPNGKPSNLTPEQWKLVRTPQFKAWFGDWENEPENASKVVDENGEPLVCFHYSPKEFSIFDKKHHPKIANFVENKYHKHLGYDFSTKKGFFQTKDSFEYKVFLNVKNIFNIKYATENQFEPLIRILSSIPYFSHYEYRKSDLERNIQELKKGEWDSLELPSIEKYLSKKYDGLIMYERDWENIKVYSEKNIKLADGTNTTFDGSNPDIRFAEGGEIKSNSFMKWFVQWYKPISNKVNIAFSFSNHLQPFKEKNVVILDVFEKIHQRVDAKPYLKKIVQQADKYGVVIYLEPKPRHKVGYYENFGFELTPNKLFMKRKPSNPDIRFAEGGMISNVQQGDALIYKDSEFLDFDSVIYVNGVTENANGTLVSLSNGQRMFLPQVAEKFRIATPSEMNRSEIMGKELFSKGGNTKRNMKKIKRGGITYGKSHAEGGIPVKNQSTGDMLEVEGGEGIVNKRSMASDKKVKLNGKEMSICEAVSQLNQLEGGVQFSCDDVSDRQFIEAMAKGGELERGTRTEQEHIQVLKDLYAKRITPKEASKRIAKDHLKEDSRYYSKLAKMEGRMASGGKITFITEKIKGLNYGEHFTESQFSQLNKILKSLKLKKIIVKREDGGYSKIYQVLWVKNTGDSYSLINFQYPYDVLISQSLANAIMSDVTPKFGTIGGKEFTKANEYKAFQIALKFWVQQELDLSDDWVSSGKNSVAIQPFDSYMKVPKSGDTTAGKYDTEIEIIPFEKDMIKLDNGGKIFDKETEDYLSELTKKFAKGGEVVADKTETINMKDFEGYADQYNGRKNKFFKANDEYQLLVNEGMDVKNNKNLPQKDKDILLAELREKAREAKTKLNNQRKDFVDMREVKSPFYAPQLADGGIFSSLPKSVRIPSEIKEIVQSKGEFASDTIYQFLISKSERFPKIISKGIFANFRISNSKEGLRTRINFSISSKATFEKDDIGVWENVAKTLEVIPSLKYDISSISVNKIARGYDVYFFITKPLSFIDIYNITANVIQNLIDYDSFNSFQKLFKEGEKTTIPPTIPTYRKKGLPSTDIRVWGAEYEIGDKVKIRWDFSTDLGNGASDVIYDSPDNFFEITDKTILSEAKRKENPTGFLYELTNGQSWEGKDLEIIEEQAIPPTEKQDDWTWRFKTKEELKAELGGDLHAQKEGSIFTNSMIYLLGKKIKETNDSVDALFRINHNYGGVDVNTEYVFGISNPERHNVWSISSWMITDKPLYGEQIPPTEDKKYRSVKEVEEELMRWTAEKVEEKKGLNSLKYQTSHLLRYILLNQARGKMSDFTELIAMAKQSEKVNGEMVRLSNEGLPIDGFVMQLMYKKVLQLIEDIKAQIMLFVKYESDVKQELDRITFHIPYLAELDTFDKDYITHIK